MKLNRSQLGFMGGGAIILTLVGLSYASAHPAVFTGLLNGDKATFVVRTPAVSLPVVSEESPGKTSDQEEVVKSETQVTEEVVQPVNEVASQNEEQGSSSTSLKVTAGDGSTIVETSTASTGTQDANLAVSWDSDNPDDDTNEEEEVSGNDRSTTVIETKEKVVTEEDMHDGDTRMDIRQTRTTRTSTRNSVRQSFDIDIRNESD